MSYFMLYMKWYLSLDGVLYFNTDLEAFKSQGILTVFNGVSFTRDIKQMNFYYKKDGLVHSLQKGEETEDLNQKLALIDPSIKKEDLDECILKNYTTFLLSSSTNPKDRILDEHYARLSTAYYTYNIILLDEERSKAISQYFQDTQDINFQYSLRPHTALIHKSYILSCLITISLCVVSIFYLVCGIYSSKNPIVTEFELNRFQVVKFRDIGKGSMEACLICFENYNEEDLIRILLCKHYFHKDCVDKWLCEQSSRCPYCRCTNKYYDELV